VRYAHGAHKFKIEFSRPVLYKEELCCCKLMRKGTMLHDLLQITWHGGKKNKNDPILSCDCHTLLLLHNPAAAPELPEVQRSSDTV
jgi:hypothetical protein